MALYKKKPEFIHAIEYTGKNFQELSDFTGQNISALDSGEIFLSTRRGIVYAKPGDFVVTDANDATSTTTMTRETFFANYEQI